MNRPKMLIPKPISLILPAAIKKMEKSFEEDTEKDTSREAADWYVEKLEAFKSDVIKKIPLRFRPFLNKTHEKEDLEELASGEIITILGPVGVGKTAEAFSMAYQYLINLHKRRDQEENKNPITYLIKTSDDFIFEIRAAYSDYKPQKVRKQYERVNLLVLDDLFAGKITDSVHEEILHLINYRSAWMLPTIITTNKSLNDLKGIDARIPSRLSGGHVFELDGPDRRPTAKK